MRSIPLLGLISIGMLGIVRSSAAADCPMNYAVSSQAAPSAINPLDPRQAQLQARFAQSKLPGYCAMRFAPGSKTCFAGGFAVAGKVPYSIHTRQPIGSVSKILIGLALAQLSAQKKLNLDAPIDQYLSWRVRNPRFPAMPITLRQLATHTSSVRDRAAAYRKSYVAQQAESLSLAAYLESYLQPDGELFDPSNFIQAAPGSKYEYSNIGAALAAYVIEVELNMPFDRYVKDNILDPIGMQSSFKALAADAKLYRKNQSEIAPYRLITYPDGGLIASCSDLSLYLQAIVEAQAGRASALDAKVVQSMLAPQFAVRPAKLPEKITNHGLFWEIRGEKIGHTGSDPGVTALVSFHRNSGMARVQLTNIDIEESPALTQQFVELWQLLQ